MGSGLPPDAAFLWARRTAPDSVHTGNSDTILMTGLTTDLDAREDRLETPREKKKHAGLMLRAVAQHSASSSFVEGNDGMTWNDH